MSDIFEGLGTAAEGGLFSRALEPDSGARKAHPHQPEACLNCGTQLEGAYCHACGQVGHVHRTIGAFLHDLVHGALHFEGKFWHTLPMLVIKPGKLTRRYIAGQRARFVSPMALFLFCVFLMFAVFQFAGISTPTDIGGESAAVVTDTVQEQTETVEKTLVEAIQDREDLLKSLAENDAERAEVEAELADLKDRMEGIETAKKYGLGNGADISLGRSNIPFIDKAMKKWEENPSLMLYKLQANFYKFSWLLIPLSLPFVWLLFAWKRRYNGYDHAVFITYSLSFMTLLLIALALLALAGVGSMWIFFATILIPPIHMYKQLRQAYDLSRFSAAWRLAALMMFITIILTVFLNLLILLGIMG